jgi:hypothetical protein
MKHIFFLLLVLCLTAPVLAQSDTTKKEKKKYGITFKGFIKSDYWYDTRQVVASREELFLFYPRNELLDNNGHDINGEDYVNFSPVTSRLCGYLSGPKAFGAQTSGLIEGDFSGVTNADINGFRLRHAFAKLKWQKSELLFGQYWHPMFVTEVFPTVISLNTGAPFQPFIRNPQISFTRFFNNFNANIALLTQRDNASDGPMGFSGVYMRNALIPNIHLQLQYKNKKHVAGIAADWKTLRPRLVTDSLYITKQQVSSYAFMGYWKYSNNLFTWKCKSIYGQNLTEHLLMGGYAVHSFDSITATETYTPTNNLFVWGNILYGKKYVFGLFGGFAKNLGTSDTNIGKYYARGADIDYVYRIAPSFSWVTHPLQISFEPEYTVAAYGTPNNKGVVENSKEIANLRLLLTFLYFF